jgi:hypothetical protein
MKVKNSNIFPLPNNPHMLHLGTIEKGFQEFIVMACIRGQHRGKIYIEEAVLTSVDWSKDVFGNCKFVADDALAEDLARFAEEKGITDMKKVFAKIEAMGQLAWLTG